MGWPVLPLSRVKAAENATLAHGSTLGQLIHRAAQGCSRWLAENYPAERFPSAGILAGCGHNGADALGIGLRLREAGRAVHALVVGNRSSLKPHTCEAAEALEAAGGIVHFLDDSTPRAEEFGAGMQLEQLSFWVDGLHGFGLNRPLQGIHLAAIRLLQNLEKPIVSVDIPSGLSADFGRPDSSWPSIRAADTLALGCLKPAHLLDSSIADVGRTHLIDMGFDLNPDSSDSPIWQTLNRTELAERLEPARRRADSHKYKNGRLLIIAGSEKYLGAAVMACLGAAISGAGMIHAYVPQAAASAILSHTPEVIIETRLPDLNKFDAVVAGPGLETSDDELRSGLIAQTHSKNSQCRFLFDAGFLDGLRNHILRGEKLNSRVLLTPHGGEFARLFPNEAAHMTSPNLNTRITSIEAAVRAARSSGAVICLKGARSCVADPLGNAKILLDSSPLLAHAGHGDVLAGLAGGLLARGLSCSAAAELALLLQSSTALQFSAAHPAALTLPPVEFVRQMQSLRLEESI